MGLGNLLRKGADLADTATSAVSDAAKGVKDKATGLAGDEKDEVVFDGAIELVQDALIGSDLMSAEINAVLKAVKDGNPYK